VSADPTDVEIDAILFAAPVERWRDLWAAVEDLETESQHVRWGGGQQVDTTTVDGVEPPMFQMPYAVYSDAVNHTVQALYDLDAIVPFNWPDWDGVERFRGGRGLDSAPVADAIRLATAIVRADRFSEGTIAATLDDGTFLAALRRVRQWYEDNVRQLPTSC
jgi:O-acetyl-ADP-ribose deacetylase